MFDLMPQLGWVADADGWIFYYNRRWYEYTGATPQQMEGWGWQSVHDPAHLASVLEQWRASLANGQPFEHAFPLRRHDGVFRRFMTHATPVRDSSGTIVRWIGINTDIDDEVRAKKVAADAMADRGRLFMDAPAAIGVFRGPSLIVELANPALLEVWGRTPAVIGMPLLEALPEARGQGFDELLLEVMRTGKPHVGNEVAVELLRGGSLETAYFNFLYTPVTHADGVRDGAAVFAFEVTALTLAKKRSSLGAAIGRSLGIDAPLAEQLHRCCEAIVGFGAAFARIWTYNDPERALDLRASAGMYTHLDGPHARVPLGELKIGRIAQSRTPHLTNRVLEDPEVSDREWAKREGMVAFAGYPLIVGDRLVGVMALFAKSALSDDTLTALAAVADLVALGIERDENERFRGLFIGMLGHDLRNPLSAVLMSAQVLLARAASAASAEALQPQQRTIVDRIRSSAARMARMIDQILDFTRVRSSGVIPLERRPSDLRTVLAQTVDELATAHPEQRVDAEYSGDATGAWDEDRLSQVFSNLIGNALTHGSRDTPVRVEMRATDSEVRCTVGNRGAPIPPDLLPTLFDPFRRAVHGKTGGTQGLGLGLFISKQIVQAHGGTIAVASTASHGTELTVVLPRANGPRA